MKLKLRREYIPVVGFFIAEFERAKLEKRYQITKGHNHGTEALEYRRIHKISGRITLVFMAPIVVWVAIMLFSN